MTELLNRYSEGSALAGVVYIHRISDNRFGGITGRIFNMFRKFCGESALKNVVLVTNMWKEGPQDIDEAREKELSSKFFKLALNEGAQMARHHNTTKSARDILRKVVGNRPVVLQIQRELVDEGKDIIDTAAGESINQELKEQTRRHQAEMMEALKVKDEEMRQEAQEREREHKQQLADLDRRLRDETNAFAAYRAKLKHEMEPQNRVAAAVRTLPRQTPYVRVPFYT